MIINKVVAIEIDNELFDRNLDYEFSSWSFDYDDLVGTEEIFNYLLEYEKEAVNALEKNEIDYIEVYKDI